MNAMLLNGKNGQTPSLNYDKNTKFMMLKESVIWHKQTKGGK